MNIFLLGGWVARPSAFYFVAFLCSPCLIVLAWSLCLLLSPCLFPVFFVARVPVLNLTALCHPCLFLVGLAFPHRLALILH